MNGLEQMLILRDNAKNQLEQIQSVEEGISYLNKLSAIDVWVKAEKKDAELQNIIAEQKIRTQRVLGQLIRQGQDSGEIKTPSTSMAEGSKPITSFGLNHKQSSTFQQIASIPEETFEEFIHEKKAAVNDAVAELTTKGAVRLARSLKEKEDSIDVMQDVNEELELMKLAKHINMTYTKEQRKLIVSLIKI